MHVWSHTIEDSALYCSSEEENPNKIIWIRIEDFKSAYRRIHLGAKTAFKSAVKIELQGKEYILVSLRLPFGGAPCPSDFYLVSDVMTDTINDLLACEHWDPSSVASEYLKNIPPPIELLSDVPFANAIDFSVDLSNKKIVNMTASSMT